MKKFFGKPLGKLTTMALAVAMMMALAVPAMASMTGASDANVAFTAATTDPLTLLSVPELDFGTHELEVATYYYEVQSVTGGPLAVQDKRGETTSAWNVTVKLGQFTDSSAVAGLTGSRIRFSPLTFSGADTGAAPAASTITGILATYPSTPTTGAAPIQVTSGGAAVKIFYAAAGIPAGIWRAYWIPSGGTASSPTTITSAPIELEVPTGTAQAETYEAQMDWTLANTP